MARPNKSRLDYFPLDVDIFENKKVALISAEFGYKGEVIFLRILCAIYRNGYYLEWNDFQKMNLLSRLPRISVFLLERVVEKLMILGLFEKSMFDTYKIITSKNIQEVYFSATSRRKMIHKELPYLLLNIDNKINAINNEGTGKSTQDVTTKSKIREDTKPLNPPVKQSSCKSVGNVLFSNKDGIERNYEGLIERLNELNITDKNQVEEIIKLSNGGMIGHYVWEVLADFHKSSASAIKYPGLFIISKLKEYEKENFNLGNENN